MNRLSVLIVDDEAGMRMGAERALRHYGFQLPGFDDQVFALELLEKKHVLITPGSSFNVPYSDHFRLTTLPDDREIGEVFARMEEVLESMADR